jgi:hypothetical protein
MVDITKTEEGEEEVNTAKNAKTKRDQKQDVSMRKINGKHGDDLKRLAE